MCPDCGASSGRVKRALGIDGADAGPEPGRERPQPQGLLLTLRESLLQCGRIGRGVRRIQGSGAHPSLLSPTGAGHGEGHLGLGHEHSHSHRGTDLVSRQRHQVHVLPGRQGHVPHPLHRVGVDQRAAGSGGCAEGGQVLDGAGLVVDQRGADHADPAIGERFGDPLGAQRADGVHRQLAGVDRRGAGGEGTGGGDDRRMVRRSDCDRSARRIIGVHAQCHGAHGEVVRLGASRGHDQPGAADAEERGDLLEGLVEHPACPSARGVDRGRVAPHCRGLEEGVPCRGPQHRGRGVIEVGALALVEAHQGFTGSCSEPPSSSPSPPWESRLRSSSSSSFWSARQSARRWAPPRRVHRPRGPPGWGRPDPAAGAALLVALLPPRSSGSFPASSSASRRFSSIRSPLSSVVSESSLPVPPPPWPPSPSPPPPPRCAGREQLLGLEETIGALLRILDLARPGARWRSRGC